MTAEEKVAANTKAEDAANTAKTAIDKAAEDKNSAIEASGLTPEEKTAAKAVVERLATEAKSTIEQASNVQDVDAAKSKGIIAINSLSLETQNSATKVENRVNVYQVYNPNTGEWIYTTDKAEYDNLVKVGWTGEGVAWIYSNHGTAIYRLYDPKAKAIAQHLFTTDVKEREKLEARGWQVQESMFKGL